MFRRKYPVEWPSDPCIKAGLGDDVGVNKVAEVMALGDVCHLDEHFTRYSSWFKLVKAVA